MIREFYKDELWGFIVSEMNKERSKVRCLL